MNKKTMFIIGGLLVIAVLIVGGILIYRNQQNNDLSNWSNDNVKYTKCIEDAEALEEINNNIIAEVDSEIEKCIRDYIKENGYEDDLNCMQEPYDNPICSEEKRDADGNNIGRYNIEVFGNNICNGYDKNGSEIVKPEYTAKARRERKGYEEGIPSIDCIKYLGED